MDEGNGSQVLLVIVHFQFSGSYYILLLLLLLYKFILSEECEKNIQENQGELSLRFEYRMALAESCFSLH